MWDVNQFKRVKDTVPNIQKYSNTIKSLITNNSYLLRFSLTQIPYKSLQIARHSISLTKIVSDDYICLIATIINVLSVVCQWFNNPLQLNEKDVGMLRLMCFSFIVLILWNWLNVWLTTCIACVAFCCRMVFIQHSLTNNERSDDNKSCHESR